MLRRPEIRRTPSTSRRRRAEQSGGGYVGLRRDELLVLPAEVRERNRLRAIACPATDPITFALLDGRTEAAFPDAAGWSITDIARRAIVENRDRLIGGERSAAAVLGAARASLLAESVAAGAPCLPITPSALAEALADRVGGCALDEVVTEVVAGREPSVDALDALAADVVRLDGLA